MGRKTGKELGFSSESLSFPRPAFPERVFGKFPGAFVHQEGDGYMVPRGRSTEAFPTHPGHSYSLLSLPALPEANSGANTPLPANPWRPGSAQILERSGEQVWPSATGVGLMPWLFFPAAKVCQGASPPRSPDPMIDICRECWIRVCTWDGTSERTSGHTP